MKKLIQILIFISALNLYSQNYSFPLNYFENQKVIHQLSVADSFVHTSFLPIMTGYTQSFISDKDVFSNPLRERFLGNRKYQLIWQKVLSDDLIKVQKNNFEFRLNFLLDYSKTRVRDNITKYSQNTRGFEIHGTLGKNISFYTDFFENQAFYVPYLDSIANKTYVTQGAGLWKLFGTDKTGKDYSNASGYLSFYPNKNLLFQIGSSKFFIGNGYRSALLSDNSFSYPFARFSYTKKRFQYNVLYTEFQSFEYKYYNYHQRKHGTFIFLNFLPFKKTEIGLFEGIIWRTSDDSTYVNKFPALFFVPIPLLREAVYGLNNEHNAVIGLNFRTNLFSYLDLYSQFLLDDISSVDFRNRYSYQIGAKIFDVFAQKIAFARLFLQYEYNCATPYTYSHNFEHSAYANLNQPLANPLGSGFKESIIIADLNILSFGITAKYNNIVTSYDINGSNFGNNILLSNKNADFMNKQIIGQGNLTNINYFSLEFYYEINTRTHLRIFGEITNRKMKNDFTENELFFVSFGIKNLLKNFYKDL